MEWRLYLPRWAVTCTYYIKHKMTQQYITPQDNVQWPLLQCYSLHQMEVMSFVAVSGSKFIMGLYTVQGSRNCVLVDWGYRLWTTSASYLWAMFSDLCLVLLMFFTIELTWSCGYEAVISSSMSSVTFMQPGKLRRDILKGSKNCLFYCAHSIGHPVLFPDLVILPRT